MLEEEGNIFSTPGSLFFLLSRRLRPSVSFLIWDDAEDTGRNRMVWFVTTSERERKEGVRGLDWKPCLEGGLFCQAGSDRFHLGRVVVCGVVGVCESVLRH